MDERTEQMLKDYQDGRRIPDICRDNGIKERRFHAIMSSVEGFNRRPVTRHLVKPALSPIHKRIGVYLYDFYSTKGMDRRLAANRLGWSSLRLKNVEVGTYELTLLDLQDIQTFTGIPYEALMNGS